ncbi:MAG TPA: TonB-dependent receptor [Acidobacteriota bacterium]|nr:TonB-dependent receptor [Acidobacteriota bacterium]
MSSFHQRVRVALSRIWGKSAVALMAVILLCGGIGFAQERFGSIVGVVTDSTNAVLPGANVTITNSETGRVFSTETNDEGRYFARELLPGRYNIKVEMPGFITGEMHNVLLLLGRTAEANITLQVGGSAETVIVRSDAVLIDTQSTAITHNVTAEEFDRMPKARSFQDIALTSPSVNSGDIEGGIQINGASGAENQFTIDGLSTTGVLNGNSRQDAVFEFLQEVQVKTNGIEAEYGGALGGVISAVTKSGGNQFHGELHWYSSGSPFKGLPNKRLMVDPVSERSALYVQDKEFKDHRNEIGGSIGGPILRDKLFFFTSISPEFRHREANIVTESGQGPSSTFEADNKYINAFTKLSWDPHDRLRTNFTWLHTTSRQDGTIPAYTGTVPNSTRQTLQAIEYLRPQGWYMPKNSYTGNLDFLISNDSLVSFRGGYFWDNYKNVNPISIPQVAYGNSAMDLPFENFPEELKQVQGWYNVPNSTVTFFDITTRGFFQGDYSKTFELGGTHNFKAGAGVQKLTNKVDQNYQAGQAVMIYWDTAFKSLATGETGRGIYGYYRLREVGTQGSTGSTIDHLYFQDQWRIHPRLTLNLGLRTEKETIPAFRVKAYAVKFGWGDKLAPRLGAAYDLFGDGKVKIYGSWGRFFDWTKYELVRGSFGGDIWRDHYYALDTLDIFSLSLQNHPGRNLWSSDPSNPFRDYRIPSFGEDDVDPDLKPMFVDKVSAGFDYQLTPSTVVSVHYVHDKLTRTIEDIGRLVDGSEVYTLGNPGEGRFKIQTNHYGATPDFPMPKPNRQYDALELAITRRFSTSWFLGGNYTWSRLYGNYAGLSNTDEIAGGGTGTWATDQSPTGVIARPGGNANRNYDSDEILFDSHGRFLDGRLQTDRPHVLKLYGAYEFAFGTTLSARFHVSSGTPLTTMVENLSQVPMFVEGRGDLGRTPVLSQTDLMISHEINIAEGKELRFEFNTLNLFNQKTARYRDVFVNRFRVDSTEMDMSQVNLLEGYDWRELFAQSEWAQDPTRTSDPYSLDPAKNFAVNPMFGKDNVFNPGFSGRFGIKFIF